MREWQTRGTAERNDQWGARFARRAGAGQSGRTTWTHRVGWRRRRRRRARRRCVTWVCTSDRVDKHATLFRPEWDRREPPRGEMLPACVYGCYIHYAKAPHMNAKRGDATDSAYDMTPKLFVPLIVILGITIAVISTLLSRYIDADSTGELQPKCQPF